MAKNYREKELEYERTGQFDRDLNDEHRTFDARDIGEGYRYLTKTPDGKIILADEISPDTCRLWDKTTGEKLDKDRFRRDLGGVEDAYHEIMKRLMGE